MKNNSTKIYIGRTSHSVNIPKYETELSAGMDVCSIGRYIIFPQQKIIVNTGLVVAIEGFSSLDVRPRSGISLNTPLEITNSPGTIDADYRGEIGIIMKNTSLPTLETWKNDEYVKLWSYLKDNGMQNGSLTEENIEQIKNKFGQIFDLKQKGNMPGIYVINPGDRVAQILMGDQTKIEFFTERFFTDKEKEKMKSDGINEEAIFNKQEELRNEHLKLVENMGNNRGGAFGHTGI